MVSRKTLKKIDLENFKPLYTNKKVQLQLEFLNSPAVAGLFFISNKKKIRSESFSIRTSEARAPASELVLQRGSLPSEIATAGLFD